MSIHELLNDSVLEDDIQFPYPLSSGWQQPQRVFLTGSTGFLGVYLLAELLRQTTAKIHCLVRAENPAAGLIRIRTQMNFYQLWQEDFVERIIVEIGDLALSQLGMSAANFNNLSAQIDVIYHNGAQVNAMYPYSRLRACNVGGTREILRLAGMHHTKVINFISTLTVFFSDQYLGQIVPENNYATLDGGLRGGYKQSKWVAESLIRHARERGLPAIIYRPGRILGDRHTGIIERLSDLLGNLLQGCIQLRQFPVVDTQINFAPVDYVSHAIVYLGQQFHSLGNNFHLCNPESISWNALWEIIKSLGYTIEEVSFADWSKAIAQQVKTGADRELFLILHHLLRSPIYLFSPKPIFSTEQTASALQNARVSCPRVDRDLMSIYLDYFRGARGEQYA